MSEPVDYLDLLEIGERVKCMDIVSLSQGNFFLYKALVMQNDKVKEDLLLQVRLLLFFSVSIPPYTFLSLDSIFFLCHYFRLSVGMRKL